MELVKCLFGVVVVVILACDVTAQHHWMPLQKHQPPLPSQRPQQQSQLPPPAAPFDKCQVEQRHKIQCGTGDITAEQCENINCCFDGGQCYYGKAGRVISSASRTNAECKISAAARICLFSPLQ